MPRSYLIDRLIPSNEISFVFGSPGAGKSSLICHIAKCLISGTPLEISGRSFAVRKVQLGYAAFDRSTDSIGDLLAKYGLAKRIQWRSYRNVTKPDGSDQRRIEDIPADFPDCEVIVLDGLGLTIPTGKTNDYCTVGNYVRYCGTLAERHQRTFFGTLHSPKPRMGEGISNPRMGMLGSTAFPGIAEAMIQVEHYDVTNPEDPNRVIRFMPHDAPALDSKWAFNDAGILVETCESDAESVKAEQAAFFSVLPPKFPTHEAIVIGDKMGLSRRTCERYLRELVEASRLVSQVKGQYTKQVIC